MLPLDLVGSRVDIGMIVAKLEEALKTTAGVLRPLTVETVGQAHDKACALQPLPLTRSDELVDDTLRVVCEVTELCLPDSQRVGGDERVTEFKTEGTIF